MEQDGDLSSLEEDISAFYAVRDIKRLHQPSKEEFLREAVSAHQPCIITGLIDDWTALEKWKANDGFLADAPAKVPVNLTLNGRADSVIGAKEDGREYFVTPAETVMSTKMFLDMLDNPIDGDPIPYLSSQDDNIRKKMPTLLESIPNGLPLAECFKTADGEGGGLEAINLWLGDERSVSSTHKDFFENFYCVVRGEKEFTLLPPTDVMHLKTESFPKASFKYDEQVPTLRPSRDNLIFVPKPSSLLIHVFSSHPAFKEELECMIRLQLETRPYPATKK